VFFAAVSWTVIALALWLALFFDYIQLPIRSNVITPPDNSVLLLEKMQEEICGSLLS